MIIKEKDDFKGNDKRGYYGHKQEQDVAFYLRREFASDASVNVINDLLISDGGENAQIDHLIIHPYGFVIIESKSIHGEIRVNSNGEWSRSYRGRWAGIASPISQAEMQQAILKKILQKNTEKFMRSTLGKRHTVGGRTWDVICAVSSSAIVNRSKMPKPISQVIVKSEFIVKSIKEIIGNTGPLSMFNTKPKFFTSEMEGIIQFLLNQHPANSPLANSPTVIKKESEYEPQVSSLSCKSCGNVSSLHGRSGRYGHYVKCGDCGTNTAMKSACIHCGSSQVKVGKRGSTYTANCADCKKQSLVFEDS